MFFPTGITAPPVMTGGNKSVDGNQCGFTRIAFNDDSTPYALITLQNRTGGALTKGQPYAVTFGLGPSGNLQVSTISTASTGSFENFNIAQTQTTTTVSGGWSTTMVVVAATAVPNNSVGEFVYWGYFDCMVEGTNDVAVGDTIGVLASKPTGFVQDTAAASVNYQAPQSKAAGIALAAQAANSAVLTRCFLFGRPVVVSPS